MCSLSTVINFKVNALRVQGDAFFFPRKQWRKRGFIYLVGWGLHQPHPDFTFNFQLFVDKK